MAKNKLTPKEQRFVEEYPIDFNATDAARRAGYPAKSDAAMRTRACKLLTKGNIQAAIRGRIDKLTEHADDITKRLIQETMRLSFSDVRKLFDEKGHLKEIITLDDETAASISSIEVTHEYSGRGPNRETIGYVTKIKMWDKNPALDKLFRYMALYKDPGTKDNPLHVLHGRIDLSTIPLDELTRIRNNPELAAALLPRN